MVIERLANGQMKAVTFAEPGTIVQHNNETGLLPGDRLLEVNGVLVDDKSREEIIDLIKSSGSSVTVKVQPVAELSELTRRCGLDGAELELDASNIRGGTLRRSGSRRFTAQATARSEEQLASERAWLQEAERLWLVHRAGFSAARRLRPDQQQGGANSTGTDSEPEDGGKVRLCLEASGETILVDEDDVEKANPPQFDRAEDLAHLRYLNESSILHTLRQRFGSNLVHTYAGGSMIVINPMAPLAIYSEKVVHMFRGCKPEDMPPHIYSLAQSAYRSMLASRKDQSVVLLGRSGSGKSTCMRHILHYLALAAGTVNKVATVEKLNAIATVMEAFGNARTVMNCNATRFTQIFSLDFDQSGQIASASIQVLLPERCRVVRRPDGEPTFHIFYRMLAGVEGSLRKELYLDSSLADNNLFMTPLQKHEDKQRAMQEFSRVCAAMKVLGISDTEAKVIWSVIAAIYHLGVAGAVKGGNGGRWQFGNPRGAQNAAKLLGTSVEELGRLLFGQGTPSTPRQPFRTPSPTERDVTGLEALEGLAVGLYGEVFSAIGALVNRSISASTHTVSSIVIIDCPGFQNPASCGHQGGGTFEDLCHNYLQERLQLLFHHTTLVAPRDRYAQEHIECNLEDHDGEICSPAPMVSLLDRASQNTMLRTSQTDLRAIDRRGLLWLLDEEAVFPNASDEGFLERLLTHYGDRDHQLLIRKAAGNNQFVLHHLQGTNPVLYTATGWLRASRENPLVRSAVCLLQESSREEVSQLFVSIRGTGVSSTLGGSVVGIEGTQSLRRASSIRRTFTTGTAGIKRKSVCLQVKFTVDGLVETLRRTRLKFVHCFLPQHNAGLGDSKSCLPRSTVSNSTDDAVINVPLIRSQLRGSQILEAVRLHKQGFPKFLPLPEFRRRFRLLAPVEGRPSSPVPDERRAVEEMLLGIDIDSSGYRVGLSQIFFRSGVLAQLEAQRDERLTDHVIRLQAQCRGYLARRKLNKLKIQDLAVRCIQRNVRKFLVIRDWPWWRLLVRVTPLLNVHRTEEELRIKTEELDALRAKVEKLEQERTHMKHDADRLEAKKSTKTKMLPGSSRFGPGIVDNQLYTSPASILPSNKRFIQPIKRTLTTGSIQDRSSHLSIGLGLNTPTQLSASSNCESFSPSQEYSFKRDVFSPRRQVFSPTREIPYRDKAFSPTRTYPSREQVFSPTRELHSREQVFSPTRELHSREQTFSPVRNVLLHKLQFSPTREMSPNRQAFSPNFDSRASSVMSDCTSGSDTGLRSISSMSSVSRNTFSREMSAPRRVFPQTSASADLKCLEGKEKSPVVFGAGLSFLLGAKKQHVHHQFRPIAAHLEASTASSALSTKISEFLRKSDHVMDEWRRLGRKDPDDASQSSLPEDKRRIKYGGRNKSATNILIKGFQLFSKGRANSHSQSMAKITEASTFQSGAKSDDETLNEADELSEMTADLAEEHSTATLATERLEAETSERLRLEKELSEVQYQNQNLHHTSERLEMELLCMRAADVNGLGSEEEVDGEDAGVYKQRYERAVRELEFTRRRLQQQHEDDLEQLVALKKQLEKKLADAYEEVEEQRQVVGQWKRKVQKLNAETSDLRLLLEEQNSRNNLLEKKQRKFDSEFQLLQDELRQEKQQKERLFREKELAVAEKYTLEQDISGVRLELELKEEKLSALTRELDELTFGGKTEEEVAQLKKAKHEMEKRLKEQEEELDDLAGQVQLLEQAKLRLEMSLEQQRKESRREAAQRDEELEDVRCSAQKKVKALEAQLESEHEERTLLLREKHELERRLAAVDERGRANRSQEEEQLQRLKRDLRRTKILLRDAHAALERAKADSPGKALIRQLRNQLEDAEFARNAAVKARQTAEMELHEAQGQLEEAQRLRVDADERAAGANRERSELRLQLEENEEELAEVLKKYRATVQQLSVEQMSLQEQAGRISELESERASLREQLAELSSKLENIETLGDPSSSLAQRRLEMKTKELESRLELEQTTRSRLEVQITRLKEAVEKLQDEAASARSKEQAAQDGVRKLQRTLRELREEQTAATAREAELSIKRKDLEKRLEVAEAEASSARGDLRLALTRIEDLQTAIRGDLEGDSDNDNNSDSIQDSDGSDESLNVYLTNHKTQNSPSPRTTRKSLELDITSRTLDVPSSRKVCESKESFA